MTLKTNKRRVIAIIQARMSATRLPGKVLLLIEGEPMLAHVVRRVRQAKTVDEVVVATSISSADDPIAEYCRKTRIACFRGSETDVLDRYHRTAEKFKADVIVRITADCPLIDPAVIDKVSRAFFQEKKDYVTNTLVYTYPDGLDVEVFSLKALRTATQETKSPVDREHVTPYLRSSGRFSVGNVYNDISLPAKNMRWTVDEPADLDFVKRVFARLNPAGHFGMKNVLGLLAKEPDVMKINNGTIRNQGYYLSLFNEPLVPARKKHKVTKSLALKKRAQKVIPSCSQTFSKSPSQFVQGVAPVFLRSGHGCRVIDVDGNEYIDYLMALGPLILGYSNAAVNQSATEQLKDGVIFSLPHPLEVEVAELLTHIIPCAEMVRFGKNGSDATAGAVRAARAYTGREVIVCCGYHGWQDWYIGTTTRDKGVPNAVKNLTVPFTYNNIDSLKSVLHQHQGKVAAIIMEPIGIEVPQDGFLQAVKDLATKEGALLIFDEVVTGFRLALGGAQEYFGVTPDLACVGKAIANGFPLSAVVGRRDIMAIFDEIFFSFTAGGEAASLAAAKETIHQIQDKKVIAHLWEQGGRLKDGFTILAEKLGLADRLKCVGLAPRTVVQFVGKDETQMLLMKSYFQQECIKRGILFSGAHVISAAHTAADIDETLRVYRTVMTLFKEVLDKNAFAERLLGDPVQPVFRKP